MSQAPQMNQRKRGGGRKQDKEWSKKPRLTFRPQRSTVVDREAKKLAVDLRKAEEKRRKEEEKIRKAAEKEEKRLQREADKLKKDLDKQRRAENRAVKQEEKREREEKLEKKERSVAKQAEFLSNFVVRVEKSPQEVKLFEIKKQAPPDSDEDDEGDSTTTVESDSCSEVEVDIEDDSCDTKADPEIEILVENIVKTTYPNAAKFCPMPFPVKSGMSVAPIHRRNTLTRVERRELDGIVGRGGFVLKYPDSSVAEIVKELKSKNEKPVIKNEGQGQLQRVTVKAFKFREHELQKMPSFPGVWPREEEIVRKLRRVPWRQAKKREDADSESGEDIWDESADDGTDDEDQNEISFEIEGDIEMETPVDIDNHKTVEDFPTTRSGLARAANDVEHIKMIPEYSDTEDDADESDGDDHVESDSDQESDIISDDEGDNTLEIAGTRDSSTGENPYEDNSFAENWLAKEESALGGDPSGYAETMESVKRDWKNLDVQIKSRLPQNLRNFFDIFLS